MENMYEWLYMARTGSPEALRYLWEGSKGMIIRLVADACHTNPIIGECKDDLIQEGMYCVYKAVAMYRYGMGASFKTFTRLLLDRKICNEIRDRRRERNIPQELTVSLNELFCDEHEIGMFVEQRYTAGKPEYMLRYHEALEVLEKTIEEMSENERRAVQLWIDSLNGRVTRENRTPEELRAIHVLYAVKRRIIGTVRELDS